MYAYLFCVWEAFLYCVCERKTIKLTQCVHLWVCVCLVFVSDLAECVGSRSECLGMNGRLHVYLCMCVYARICVWEAVDLELCTSCLLSFRSSGFVLGVSSCVCCVGVGM